jgi:ABC-type multidrug transport system fused ATPase/permease subunit
MNGLELRDITEESLMKSISLISHDSYLFNGTVRENLRVGNPIATDREMLGAIECVRLDDFLKGEAGLDTFLSEKASNLSGGQRQRLALARALLHNSAIYIFDEATSNIDSESENYIIDMIHKLAQHKKTVILISHRLVNVMNADRIYVLSQGRVVESGNHMSLLENDGIYKELWHKQQALECFLKREVGV